MSNEEIVAKLKELDERLKRVETNIPLKRISEAQKKFIIQLCADLHTPPGNLDDLTRVEASAKIDGLLKRMEGR